MNLIERLAILMATTCNGGSWDAHFVETQREVWRQRARETLMRIDERLVRKS